MNNIIKPKTVDFENVPTTHVTKTGKKTPDFYKGTSFRWCREWESGRSYVNDDYHIDLVYHKGKSWICTESHISNSENAPSEDISVWELAVNQSGSGIHVGPKAPTPDEYGDLHDKMLWLDTSVQEDSLKVYSAVEVDLKLDKLSKDCTKQWTELSNVKANKATTLAGYGITDSYTKSNIDSKNNELNSKIDNKLGKSETALNALKLNGQNPSYYATKQSVDSLKETVNKKANSEDVDTKSEVDKKIQNAFNKFATYISTDGVVNTYKELIDYASEHSSEFVELVGELSEAQNDITDLKKDKVDKVVGKGLSTNDYSDADKALVQTIPNKVNESEFDEVVAGLSEAINDVGTVLGNTKADTDGYYPDMTVGKSDNLVGRGESTAEEFSFRPSAGNVSIGDGTARIKAIKGNSVVYNQGAYRTKTQTWDGGSTSFSSEGVVEFTGVTNATSISVGTTYKMVPDHLYLNIVEVLSMGQVENITFGNNNLVNGRYTFTEAGIYQSISKNTRNDYSYIRITSVAIGTDMTGVKVRYRVIDLTKMFGADNEPTSYKEYLQRKPINISNEFAYNKGELVDMKVNSLVSVGDNLLNFTNEIVNAPYISDTSLPAAFEPNTIYKGVAINGLTDSRYIKDVSISGDEVSITGQYGYGLGLFITALPSYQYILQSEHSYRIALLFYDEQKTMISAKYSDSSSINVVSPTNTHYCMVILAGNNNTVYTYINTILSLAHSGYKIGEYKPYEQDTKDLSWIKEYFPNGMRSAGSAYDEIRYNVTTKKWEAIKRMGVIDLGSLDWKYEHTYSTADFKATVTSLGFKKISNTTFPNMMCVPYDNTIASANVAETKPDKTIKIYEGIELRIQDSSYTDAQSFKEQLQGVILNYELAKPIEVEIPNSENWNLDYMTWDFGTEEAIASETSTPFRADIVYQFNAVDKIRNNSTKIEGLETKINKNTADIATKQKTLSLTVKDNGNIVIGNFVNNQSKEFMPATPSGDPMHYAYEAEGAVYNDSDVALEKIDWFGKTIIHESHKWYLNGLGDLSNKEMAKIYSLGRFSPSVQAPLSYGNTSYPNYATTVRTNIARLGMYNGIVSNTYFAATNYVIETINISIASQTPQGTTTINSAYTFDNCKKLKSIYGVIKLNGTATATFAKCNQLQDIKISNLSISLSFADSPLLTKESLLYMINNCESNAKFIITLHPDVYAKCTRVDEGEGQYEGEWWVDIDAALGGVSEMKNTTITLASA